MTFAADSNIREVISQLCSVSDGDASVTQTNKFLPLD